MIEIIYNEAEENDEVVKIPKNIRQIGSPKGRHKIYMEDYVYTFLHTSIFEEKKEKRGVILLGKSRVSQDIRYTFISGAINCSDFIFQEDGIVFGEECWEYIYKKVKDYFSGQDVVGWFLGTNGFPLELTPVTEAAHRKYFPGRDKVLVMSDTLEGDDVLFTYEQGVIQKKEGYYIYYEKNLPMQEYMVSLREKSQCPNQENSVVEVQEEMVVRPSAEEAIQNYRNMLLGRRGNTSQKKMNILLYTAASAAMIILCVIGITGINNHEKMKELEQTIAVLSQNNVYSQNEEEKEVGEETVTVENVPGEVLPDAPEMANQITTVPPVNEEPEKIEPEMNTVPPTENTGETEPTSGQSYIEQGFYIVQPGDSLEIICKKIYENTDMMDEICAANHIDDVDKIYAGQKLILP